MSLEALLTKLEARSVTSVTADRKTDVTSKPAENKGCTIVTSVTARNTVTSKEGENSIISSAQWGAACWLEFYNERVAMALEGNLSVEQGEQQALRECNNRWLARNPDPHADPDSCPHCRTPSGVTSDAPSTSYANPGGWALWIHDACMQAWCECRRQQAIAALAGMGIIRQGGISLC